MGLNITELDVDAKAQMRTGPHKVLTEDQNMYRIEALDPTSGVCDFRIYMNKYFGKAVESTEVPNAQDNVQEILSDMCEKPNSRVRFKDESMLLTNVTVDFQATGLDLTDRDDYGGYVYDTHNVDTARQAVDAIAIFTKWTEYADRVLYQHLSEE